MTEFAIVSTTVGSDADARSLAQSLVELRLAACVQILPVESVYLWQGKIETAQEHLLLCKIAAVDFSEVAAAIKDRHRYDVPEIVMTKIEDGAKTYIEWLGASTRR